MELADTNFLHRKKKNNHLMYIDDIDFLKKMKNKWKP